MEFEMKPMRVTLILLVALVFAITGCFQEKNYSDYNDLKQKGEPTFQKDWVACHRMSRENAKPSEGSEAAGRTALRQQALFKKCMEGKFWELK